MSDFRICFYGDNLMMKLCPLLKTHLNMDVGFEILIKRGTTNQLLKKIIKKLRSVEFPTLGLLMIGSYDMLEFIARKTEKSEKRYMKKIYKRMVKILNKLSAFHNFLMVMTVVPMLKYKKKSLHWKFMEKFNGFLLQQHSSNVEIIDIKHLFLSISKTNKCKSFLYLRNVGKSGSKKDRGVLWNMFGILEVFHFIKERILERKENGFPLVPVAEMDNTPEKCHFYLPQDISLPDTNRAGPGSVEIDTCLLEPEGVTKTTTDCKLLEEEIDSEQEKLNRIEKCNKEIKEKLLDIRWTEHSYHGRQIIKNGRLSDDDRKSIFSILSYNVLSQLLLEQHPYLYKNHDKRALKWERRSRQLLEEFREFDADIICLQELQHDHLDEFYKANLKDMGYEGIYKQRTNYKFDGCGIFYKTDKFDLIEQKEVEFFRPYVKILDRDNVGLILKLSLKDDPSRQFVVATTHLLYNPRRADIKLAQTQLFLAEIENLAYIKYNDLQMKTEYLPIILTGDMNFSPDSAIYELITQSYLKYEYRSSKVLAMNDDGWPLNKTLVPNKVGVTDCCQLESALSTRSERERCLEFETGTLKHFLNLESVFDHHRDELPEVTTNQNVWVTVDYIFYSQEVDPTTNIRQDGKLKVVSRLTLPTNEQAAEHLKYLPNLGCASDHLPLLATFHLKS